MIIKDIFARKILNSRANETIEVDVFFENGFGRGSAPSGASTGTLEAIPFPGKVDDSVSFINEEIRRRIISTRINSFDDLAHVEDLMKEFDSTPQLKIIGGNVIIALEFAILDALAKSIKMPLWRVLNPDAKNLPRPLGNAVGGGAHASSNSPDIQEFLLLSLESKSFSSALFANAKIHSLMKKELQKADKKFTGGKTDEGAWCPNISNPEILDILSKAAKTVSDEMGFKIRLGLDMAASEMFDGKNYAYHKFSKKSGKKKLNRKQQIDFVVGLIEKYDLCYVEDPLNEDDFEGFAEIKSRVKNCLICGDDLCVTNPEQLKKAIEHKSVSAVIVKPNQVGSLLKTREFVSMAKKNGITPVISHRSGETDDVTISHLAVAFDIPVIKTGISGGERLAKLNELLRIEEAIRK
jgi:enolase